MQPATPQTDAIRAIIQSQMGLEGPLLPILHALQREYGHVPQDAVPLIADALNIGRAEVHGVMTFYHDFREVPAGRHVVKICRAEACQARGSEAVAEAALARLGLAWHGTSANGAVTVEPVYCLGLCASGPAAIVGEDHLVARLDEPRLTAMLKDLGA
ncbi:formate dehydrogenase subunit gamma [Paracoccus sp. p4-l81]|uniref:formate dehydrogenase subunit gamma n=1 Tax=unclassified Paracoccus (in: a-proteobacteria) TaxID=2688777 RepID=UPI0035B6E8B7